MLFVSLVWAETAHAHGIAGNRYFDGTMTFDDPAVADEAVLPLLTYQQFPTQGSAVSENRINAAFARLLTPPARDQIGRAVRLVSISPVTTGAAREAGLAIAAEAAELLSFTCPANPTHPIRFTQPY